MNKFSPKEPARKKEDYQMMSRSPLINHLQTEIKKSKGQKPSYKITDFLSKDIWSWIYHYLKSRFGKKYPYTTYSGIDTGIYKLDQNHKVDKYISIAITADWATDTEESYCIAAEIRKQNPDYTIHLGDTYYVGAPHEISSNFLLPEAPWPIGKKGSFALLGNHEMYARGSAYFKYLLPHLGIWDNENKISEQKAAFFCLENEYWRVLGLDTGYNSTGKIPFLELLPYFASDCRFEDQLMKWLKDTVKLDDKNDKRGLVILTHHQYVTAFGGGFEYIEPAKQLASLIGTDRPVLWFWGHEHKFSIFDKVQVDGGVSAYGRCIGHGGMPVELDSKSFTISTQNNGHSALEMVDCREKKQGSRLGHNGYVVLKIKNEVLLTEYYDENKKLLTETWTVDLQNGIIKRIDAIGIPELKTAMNKQFIDIVK